MANNNGSDNIAVLIDADNVPSRIIAGLMTEVANYGTASVRRIYGDWTSSSTPSSPSGNSPTRPAKTPPTAP
jgi:hypothetical protein